MRFPLDNWNQLNRGYRFGDKTFYNKFHNGLDLIVPIGRPLYAPEQGMITFVRINSPTAGKMIYLKSASGYQYRFFHLNDIAIKYGQFVTEGQQLGSTGNTGLSSGPHLHVEVRNKNKQLVDPELHFKQEEYMTEEQYKEIIWNVVNGWYFNYLKRQATNQEIEIHVKAIAEAEPRKYALSTWINNQKKEQEFHDHWLEV